MNTHHRLRRGLLAGATAALALFATQAALAQNWPDRIVRIVNPYAPGGPSDTIVRMLAEGLSTELGQRVLVENKPGGGTVIGANTVAKAPPDGYTLLLATVAPLIVQPAINPALPYDARKDFALVGMFATVPNPGLGAPGGAHQQRQGADRLRRQEPRQAQLRVGRQRHRAAPGG